jgi:hypothetical protein
LEFAQPLLGDKPDERRFRAVMDQVVLLWNLALLPPTEQDLYWKQIAVASSAGISAGIAHLAALAEITLRR